MVFVILYEVRRECWRVRESARECERVLESVGECWRVMESVRESVGEKKGEVGC